ncbi:MAG: PPK2 family polyphosphate kinase [Sediminibacterium sp.]
MNNYDLSRIPTRAPRKLNKEKTKEATARMLDELNQLQNLLFAERKHAVLVVIQGMDASGKDGAIRNVFGQLNPLGVKAYSFKVPTAEEISHDFLWRIHQQVPPKGIIQIFNRSHYEDILVTRVHKWCDDQTAKARMKAINDFEELLQRHSNTHILKFYLHVSLAEQRQRLQERIKNPEKQWKYNERDLEESKLWKVYRRMYQDCFRNCNKAPWTIVPSDQNWYKEHIIANKLLHLLRSLKMQYPGLKK